MKYFLSPNACLKRLEAPSIYRTDTDELYELDDESFGFLVRCASAAGCEGSDPRFIGFCLEEGLLGSVHSGPRPPASQSPVPSLRYLELQITSRCNLRCRHCYIDGAGSRELGLVQVRRVLEEFQEMQGLRVLITGGEPLLHTGFSAINDLLPGFFLRKVLFTNGLLLTGRILDALNVDEIQVSVDGLEEGHDALRGEGTFTRAIAAISAARERGFEVSVSTMVHAKNLDDFDGMEKLFAGLGVRDWTVDVPCMTGRFGANPGFAVSPEAAGRYLGYGRNAGMHAGGTGYGCGPHLMSISADGRAAKCTFYADRAAGSVDEGLRTCWERIRPVRLDELSCDCDFLEECRGGCRYRAELLGDPKGKDLYRCSLYGIMETRTGTKPEDPRKGGAEQ
ncbi:MAG: radical SAM protein [Thermodesulfovibrionales bacterium]